jgi:UDP-glucuronate 4-epimerase
VDKPHLYFDVNLTGTLNLLELARQKGVRHVVFASTSSVYGRTERIPFVEEDFCNQPLAPYPASKRAAELLGYSYHHLHGLNFTALRFFTVYGPRNRPDMMAYKILSNIFFGEKVELYNGGNMLRDWTYVSDIVAGIVAAAERPLGYELINLGRGEPVNLSDFVRLVETKAGRTSSLETASMPAADVSRTFASVDKARSLLDYQPGVSVDEGVSQLWSWFESEILHA